MTNRNFSSTTLAHAGYLPLLQKHLESIDKAAHNFNSKNDTRLVHYLLVNKCDCKNMIDKVFNICSRVKNIDVKIFTTPKSLTIAQSRNFLFKKTKEDFVIFWDVDILVDKSYFNNLQNIIKNVSDKTKAIAGGLGGFKISYWGHPEFLMDLFAYYGKIETTPKMTKLDLSLYTSLNKKLTKLSGCYSSYLSGCNQIIHRDMHRFHGGFDEKYWGAEDRVMAYTVQNQGYKILFAPNCHVRHMYNFTLKDILKRKRNHGYYSAMFRGQFRESDYKPQSGLKKWIKSLFSIVYPAKTFRKNPKLFIYHFIIFWPYLCGSLLFHIEKNFTNIKAYKSEFSDFSFSSNF